eukprot:CAMPEP_0113689748 /NCGR_PEP_ID=MMETSP0038_2-20120614/17364_1 /TAXON_ID=2898 /ORGANISM="Cryptomonas paramecium" /LENGTH=218 /DNA_ID=CAMNT_0000610909 /DNA_START=41 /DNA_END=697 /DNA_ORIENTATION=+ /assembly_acc=CAM_ASM_000170
MGFHSSCIPALAAICVVSLLAIVSFSTGPVSLIGGIGTFPGGQSTGDYNEFVRRPDIYRYNYRRTKTENAVKQGKEYESKWITVSGPCKGASTVKALEDCVRKGQPKWTDNYNLLPKHDEQEKPDDFALMKPGTAHVDVNSQRPSLEDVIRGNKLPNLKPIYEKMKSLQDQLDVIKNPRNFDTEDLTSSTSDDWVQQTTNLCCANMYDTVCHEPCRGG